MYRNEIYPDFRPRVVYPKPDAASWPTADDVKEFEELSARSMHALGINWYCRDHIKGTYREQVRWMIEQYKRAAAQGGTWEPPTTGEK